MAYSVAQFCKLHNVCKATFYILKKQNKAPAVMRVGKRVLITCEAAKEWREQMTEASQRDEPQS